MYGLPAMRTWWSDKILSMRRDKRRTLLMGVFYLLAIGYVDYATGYEINLTVVYVTPLIMLTVAGGWWVGLGAVLACAFVTEMADYLAGRRFDESIYHVYSFISHCVSYFSFLFLITQLLMLYDQERDVAGRDPLTGLYNRRGFLHLAGERLHQAASERAGWKLCTWDVAAFRDINTRFGHDKADALLMTIADALRDSVTSSALLAHMGADRFLALIPEAGSQLLEPPSASHGKTSAEVPDVGGGLAEGALPPATEWLALCERVATAGLGIPVALRYAVKALPPAHRTPDELAKQMEALLDAAKHGPALTYRAAAGTRGAHP